MAVREFPQNLEKALNPQSLSPKCEALKQFEDHRDGLRLRTPLMWVDCSALRFGLRVFGFREGFGGQHLRSTAQ